jgi:hypothetical protein
MFVSFFKDFNTMKSDPSLSKRAICIANVATFLLYATILDKINLFFV